jgi:hypothetical protein
VLPELLAVQPGELIAVNRDVAFAVSTVLGALPEILALTPEMAELPGFDVRLVKSLEAYALALRHANEQRDAAAESWPDVQPLLEEGGRLRARLRADARALAQLGMIDERSLKELSRPLGIEKLGAELKLLVRVLRGSFEHLAPQRRGVLSELLAAERVAAEVAAVLELREQQAERLASATDLRTRAWTLFRRAYDHACRAVSYLRWEQGDADSIVPSFYVVRRSASRRARSPKSRQSHATEERSEPTPTPGAQ